MAGADKQPARREHQLNTVWQDLVDQYDADCMDVLDDITMACDLLEKLHCRRASAMLCYVGLKLLDHDWKRQAERNQEDGHDQAKHD